MHELALCNKIQMHAIWASQGSLITSSLETSLLLSISCSQTAFMCIPSNHPLACSLEQTEGKTVKLLKRVMLSNHICGRMRQ